MILSPSLNPATTRIFDSNGQTEQPKPHRRSTDVIEDLHDHGMPFGNHWLDAFWEFRFPVFGVRTIGDITMELRAAIEPWHVLGEDFHTPAAAKVVQPEAPMSGYSVATEAAKMPSNGTHTVKPMGLNPDYPYTEDLRRRE